MRFPPARGGGSKSGRMGAVNERPRRKEKSDMTIAPLPPPCSRCGHAPISSRRCLGAASLGIPAPPALCRPLRMPLESFKRPQEVYRFVLPKTMRFRGVFDGLRPLRGRVVGADDDPCLSTTVVRSARGYGPLRGRVRDPLRGRRCRACAWSVFDCQTTPEAVQGLV